MTDPTAAVDTDVAVEVTVSVLYRDAGRYWRGQRTISRTEWERDMRQFTLGGVLYRLTEEALDGLEHST
jgi:tRNA U54 and U55 pseudouridine synthase Pus10